MQAFFDFMSTVALSIWSVLTLDSGTAGYLSTHSLSTEIALTIAVIAGISTLVGDSVVLFLNQVRGWRFALSLLLNGFGFVLLYTLQAVVLAIVGPLVTGHEPGFGAVVRGVMISTAPLVFGFLVLIPYLGPGIARFLQVWGLLILWLVSMALFRSGPLSALLITGLSWGVMQLLSWSLSRPVTWLGDRIWRLISGQPSMMTGNDLLAGHMFMPLDHRLEEGGR
jgi:hypothetical protein